MRRRLIETLTYPRLFVLENIGLRDCPQDSLFDASCDCCRDCDLRQDCHWLRCLDNFTDLANKPVHTLHASVLYSIVRRGGSLDTMRALNVCSITPKPALATPAPG